MLKPIQLSSISKNRQLFEDKLLECLHKTNNKGLVHHYYQPETLIYSNICQELKLKKSIKNRKKLHYFWKRNFGETVKSEVNQNYKRHAKDKTTPNKSVYNDLYDLEDDDKRTIMCVKNDVDKNNNLEEHNMVSTVKEFVPVSSEKFDVPKEFATLDDLSNFGDVLPKGTVNLRSEHNQRPSYSHCNFYEGSFTVTLAEYNLMTNENDLLPSKYCFLINKKFQKVNITCKLYFKQSFFSETKNVLSVYAYCIQKNCKRFKLQFLNPTSLSDEIKINVFSTSLNFNHVRGVERQMVANSMLNKKPLIRRQTDVTSLSSQSIQLGNYDSKI